MIRRAASFLLIAWLLGFALFVVLLPRPSGPGGTDAVIVLTGGSGRLQHGLDRVKRGEAKRLFVSGVDPTVRLEELATVQDAPAALFECCVELGKEAVDTRSNAAEVARWIERRRYRSVRLVTTDWHMPRALFELKRVVDPGVRVVPDPVDSAPSLVSLFSEYNKYLLRRTAALVGL